MKVRACSIYLIDEENKILLQQRDNKPNIWNPGAWGLFGGEVEGRETFKEAVIREVKEELNYNLENPNLLQKLELEKIQIHSFYKKIKNKDKKNLKLLEGKSWGWFTLEEANKLYWGVGIEVWKKDIVELRKIILD